MQTLKVLVVTVALCAFALTGFALAADQYWVVKNQKGQVMILDQKPGRDYKVIKGPFDNKDDAQKAAYMAEPIEAGDPGKSKSKQDKEKDKEQQKDKMKKEKQKEKQQQKDQGKN